MNCKVCGSEWVTMAKPEDLCTYCWMWWKSCHPLLGAPRYGRRQRAPLRWYERALEIRWPEPQLLNLLTTMSTVRDPVFRWREQSPCVLAHELKIDAPKPDDSTC
jgi:hypothetical protein